MPVTVNLRHLVSKDVTLKGELPAAELELDDRDEVVRLTRPVEYDIEVQQMDDALLAQGKIEVLLDCLCVRCLKPLTERLELDPWTCHVPLEGEEAAPIESDSVDLTPFIREDILLAFPQHPLCDPECKGLSKSQLAEQQARLSSPTRTSNASAAWSALDKLKLKR
jgi:uncharacterized protein